MAAGRYIMSNAAPVLGRFAGHIAKHVAPFVRGAIKHLTPIAKTTIATVGQDVFDKALRHIGGRIRNRLPPQYVEPAEKLGDQVLNYAREGFQRMQGNEDAGGSQAGAGFVGAGGGGETSEKYANR